MAPIRISRAGLVECPSCHRHTYVADDVDQTACAHCGVGLRAALRDGLLGGMRVRIGSVGRAMAAGLAGLTMAACEAEPMAVYGGPPDEDVSGADGSSSDGGGSDSSTQDATSDAGAQDVGPNDDTFEVDTAEDVQPVALYGIPPDSFGEPEDAGTTDAASASDTASHDAASGDSGASHDVAKGEDVPVQPLYGAPP